MCYFPNIQFNNEFIPLADGQNGILPPSPRAMYALLVNRHIVDNQFLNGINNMAELENCIYDLIDHYHEDDPLERIFHLIQIWGGNTGRGIYIRQHFVWQEIEPIYRHFVDVIRSFETIDDNTLNNAFIAQNVFYNTLRNNHYKGMGVAFITKHLRFWMHQNLPNSMLPIYDSTFSENVMLRGRTAKTRDLLPFWRAMIAKAEEEHVSLTALERQLFNYFNN